MSEIKKLVEERRKPIVAHHSTWLGIDPQELNEDSSIHAGTMQSAYDRLSPGLDSTLKDSDYEDGEQMHSYLHSYKIPRNVINPTMHLDPDSRGVLRHSNTSRNRMKVTPEKIYPYNNPSDNRVLQYKNEVEDKGSTSYLIPSKLIHDGRVNHLGDQFVVSHVLDEYDPGNFKQPQTGFDEDGRKLKDHL